MSNNEKKEIRFISSNYEELFRIPDGEKINIILSDGKKLERACDYVDEYHVRVGVITYHICEFAEMCERNGNRLEPVNPEYKPFSVDDILGDATERSEALANEGLYVDDLDAYIDSFDSDVSSNKVSKPNGSDNSDDNRVRNDGRNHPGEYGLEL